MTDTILEIAAYACLAFGVVLLVVRLVGERAMEAAGVWRFRRRLRKLDGVPHEWTRAMGAIEGMQDGQDDQRRPPHPSRRHPWDRSQDQ